MRISDGTQPLLPMNTFRPKNEKHAIAEVAFAIYFDSDFSAEDFEKAKTLHSKYSDVLPNERPIVAFKLEMKDNQPSVLHQVAGFSFQSERRDGQPAWLLGANSSHIIVNCLTYTSWDEVWGRAKVWLADFYAVFKNDSRRVKAVSLQYVDQFTTQVPLPTGAWAELFRREADILPRRFFENDALWHVHQGWYELQSEIVSGKRLSVVRLGSNLEGDVATVTIDHLLRVELDPGVELSSSGNQLPDPIEKLMNRLHAKNKEMLFGLLTETATSAISLGERA